MYGFELLVNPELLRTARAREELGAEPGTRLTLPACDLFAGVGRNSGHDGRQVVSEYGVSVIVFVSMAASPTLAMVTETTPAAVVWMPFT